MLLRVRGCYLLYLVLVGSQLQLQVGAHAESIWKGRSLRGSNRAAVAQNGFYPAGSPQEKVQYDDFSGSNTDSNGQTSSGSSSSTTSASGITSSSSDVNFISPVGYTGVTVATDKYTHPCSLYPCRHFGQCIPNGYAFTCKCEQGWGGPYCEQAIAILNPLIDKPPRFPTVASKTASVVVDTPVGSFGASGTYEYGVGSASVSGSAFANTIAGSAAARGSAGATSSITGDGGVAASAGAEGSAAVSAGGVTAGAAGQAAAAGQVKGTSVSGTAGASGSAFVTNPWGQVVGAAAGGAEAAGTASLQPGNAKASGGSDTG